MIDDDKLLRAYAEIENLRKRANSEKAEAKLRGEEAALGVFLDAIDDLQRARTMMDEVRGRGTKKKLLDGLDHVISKFSMALGSFGISVFEAKGQAFDPRTMAAIAQVEKPGRGLSSLPMCHLPMNAVS